jgi:hypothetical protein
MFSGYFFYKHQQKVNMAEYYYNRGDYQKAADLDVGDISSKALSIVNAMDWKEDVDRYFKYNNEIYLLLFDTTISNIYSANLLFKHGSGDKDVVDILNGYYKEIADYLNVSTAKLDELNQIDYDKRSIELIKMLNKNRK